MRNETLFKRQWKSAVMAIVFIVLVASIMFATIPTTAHAKDVNFAENTIQRRIPTLNDDFDDGKVIVVLNQKNSKYNGVVRIEDFKIDVEKASLVNFDTQRNERLDRNDDVATDAVKTGQAVVTDLFRVDNAKSSSLVSESEFFQILSIDLPVRGKEKVLEAIVELEKSEIVYSAEPDYSYETIDLWVPNDTNYTTNQWGLTGTNGIQAANAWDMTRGLADIRVGLFETGAQQNHPDLNGRFLAPNFTLGNADHGTHVAGIVGAISNNNQGVAGVSQSNMMLLNRNSNDFVDSMARAANNNIWVINASYEYTSGGVIENHAVAIHNYQGLLVCAAGNSTADIDNATNRRYPAGYSAYTIPRKTFLGIETQPARPITNVVTVGSIDNGGGISSFSNFGETHVQLFAPGGNILSTFPEDRCALGNETLTHPETGAVITVRRCESWTSRPGGLWARSSTHHADGYHFMSGTSMAAPHVAGVAALIRAINQNLTPQQIKAAILDNVDTATGLSGLCSTGGRLNAHRALASVAFTTSPATGGIAITGLRTGFTLPNNTNLTLPDRFAPLSNTVPTAQQNVTAIASSAFSGCSQLSQITIPASVTSIGSSAFRYCNNLESITIPFVGSTLNGNTDRFPIIFGNDVPASLRHVIVTGGNIGDHAFYGNGTDVLKSITILSNITSIGIDAFYQCSELETVILPDGLQSIGYRAFYECSSLVNITIPSSVTSIGATAFTGCSTLATVNLGRTSASGITTLGANAFSGCSALKDINAPDGSSAAAYINATNWSTYKSYITLADLLTISLNNNGGTGGTSTVYLKYNRSWHLNSSGSDNPTKITVPQKTGYSFGGYYTSTNNGVTLNTQIINADGTWVSGKTTVFSANGTLYAKWTPTIYTISLNNNGGTGGTSTVYLKYNSSWHLNSSGSDSPSGITKPQKTGYSFGGYYTSTNNGVTLDTQIINADGIWVSGKTTTFTSSGTLYAKWTPEIYTITLNNNGGTGGTTTVYLKYNSSWHLNSNGTDSPWRITRPQRQGYSFVGYYTSTNNGVTLDTQIINDYGEWVSGKTTAFTSNGTLYAYWIAESLAYQLINGGTAYAVTGIGTITATNIIIPSTYNGLPVTKITECAFTDCSSITSVTFQSPSNVTSIEEGAFWECYDLASITLPDSLLYIGEYAFVECVLTSITIPGSVIGIGDNAFDYCTDLAITWNYNPAVSASVFGAYLRTVIVPDGITSIANNTFANCANLTNITIPSSVTSIGANAFAGTGILNNSSVNGVVYADKWAVGLKGT